MSQTSGRHLHILTILCSLSGSLSIWYIYSCGFQLWKLFLAERCSPSPLLFYLLPLLLFPTQSSSEAVSSRDVEVLLYLRLMKGSREGWRETGIERPHGQM